MTIQTSFTLILCASLVTLGAYSCKPKQSDRWTQAERTKLHRLESIMRTATPLHLDSLILQKRKGINKLNN